MQRFFHGWTMEQIINFLESHWNAKETYHNANGYEHHFADGSTFECIFADWKHQTPLEYRINGKLIYQCYDA